MSFISRQTFQDFLKKFLLRSRINGPDNKIKNNLGSPIFNTLLSGHFICERNKKKFLKRVPRNKRAEKALFHFY